MKTNLKNKLGSGVELLFVFTLLITLAQLTNHFALKPAVEGNPEPGGIIYGIVYAISMVITIIWDNTGPVIIGIMIITGLFIVINMLVSRGKKEK